MSEDFAARTDQLLQPAEAGQRLLRLYREIGLAAIACEFDLELDDIGAPSDKVNQIDRSELVA